MDTVIGSLVAMAGALLAGVMGFAIQRGGTCTVAAMEEILTRGRCQRLLAMAEAALWVGGGLLLAGSLGLVSHLPDGYALTPWSVAGGALLGVGAWLAGACVFGAIARFGSGQWAYALLPPGFYFGCLSAGPLFRAERASAIPGPPAVAGVSGWLVWLLVVLALWRLARVLRSDTDHATPAGELTRRVWRYLGSPHGATTVIGIAFLLMLLLVGEWAYTEVLAQLAMGMQERLALGAALMLALLAGAVLGGWTAPRRRPGAVTAGALARCLGGGVLMGWGSVLIPGGNDGLLLVGIPMLWPYAWVAFASMCASILLLGVLHGAVRAHAVRRQIAGRS